jgi:hypothetical protein
MSKSENDLKAKIHELQRKIGEIRLSNEDKREKLRFITNKTNHGDEKYIPSTREMFGYPIDDILDEKSALHNKILDLRNDAIQAIKIFEVESFHSHDFSNKDAEPIEIKKLLVKEEEKFQEFKLVFVAIFDSLQEKLFNKNKEVNSDLDVEYLITELQLYNIFFSDKWNTIRDGIFSITEKNIVANLVEYFVNYMRRIRTLISLLNPFVSDALEYPFKTETVTHLKNEIETSIAAASKFLHEPVFPVVEEEENPAQELF